MKLVIGSNLTRLADSLKREPDITVLGVYPDKSSLMEALQQQQPEVLLLTLSGLLPDLKRRYPQVRIVYCGREDLSSEEGARQAKLLIDSGITDCLFGNRLTMQSVLDLLRHPKTRRDWDWLYRKQEPEAAVQPDRVSKSRLQRDNVYTVTSVKPGTGKSFIASNLAVTLARYGKGKPRVLLLEGDLQNLSVFTMMGIMDEKYNLNQSLRRIKEFIREHGKAAWNSHQADEVRAFILHSCIPSGLCSNLFVMEGQDFTTRELSDVTPQEYFYLVMFLAKSFDVLVVDANSSWQHKTTDPLFQMSRQLYFVFTTDFNNLQANLHYRDLLEQFGVLEKTKFVQNRALCAEQAKENRAVFGVSDEELMENRIHPDFRIPLIDPSVMYNATYRNIPVAADDSEATLGARIRFLHLANSIMPLEGLGGFSGEIDKLRTFVRG